MFKIVTGYTAKGKEKAKTFETLESAREAASAVFEKTGIVLGIEECKPIVPVMFRVSKDDETDVFALFPTFPGDNDPWTCTCYQHVGQHSTADMKGCIQSSRPATIKEMYDLLNELGQIYHDCTLRVVDRVSPKMNTERFAALDS